MNTPFNDVFDIIFAGGGTTACVVAGRLSAADSTLRILVLENGGLTRDHPAYVQPGRYVENIRSMMAPGAKTFTFHPAKRGANIDNSPIVSNANCVGGGSSVNVLCYTRAPASDFDDWEQLGNPGWGSQDLVPLAKKLETYQAGVVDSTHGSSGPIKVSRGGHETKLGEDFLAAAAGFPRERGFTDDMNDFLTCDVYGRLPKYIDADTGRRSDAAHCYLYSQTHNHNLRIVDHARVNRVLFNEEKCVVGVEYQVGGRESAMLTVRASRLVVISAGAFGSPAILERSGIGGKDLLAEKEIQLVCDLPGVGRNYKDHHAVFAPYLAPKGGTLNSLSEDSEVFEAQWNREGTGLLAANGVDAGIKLRPNAQDMGQLTPLFAQRWKTFFAGAPDKPVAFLAPVAAYIGASKALNQAIYSMFYFTTYPMSSGSVHITSQDPFAPLEVDTGLLDLDEDLVVPRWVYKWSRELARRMDSYRGEYSPEHPQFPSGSQASCGEADGPVDITAPEIQWAPSNTHYEHLILTLTRYSTEDDAAIDAFHRANACMGWHALGTCAMKPLEAFGVVDWKLNVYGVKKLKVVDLSIAPLMVGATPNNTALIIGEKAALVIAEELGIRGV
ncbi:GMC oxidoreductase-domain-containing protein [Mycena capillaripes]|nr:GMC oxidoreductase-domain-containing protein [Mycena capillaripes]